MKKRVGLQRFLVFGALAVTIAVSHLVISVWGNHELDEIFDLLGIALIFTGFFIRMTARGQKQERSRQSESLVVDGLYGYVRNPMYLGTFLIGMGVVMALFNVPALLIFAAGFFAIYIPQVLREERMLETRFGERYRTFCQRVPRMFPRLSRWPAFARDMVPERWSWVRIEDMPLVVVLAVVVAGQTAKDAHFYGMRELSHEFMELLVVGLVFLLILRLRIKEAS